MHDAVPVSLRLTLTALAAALLALACLQQEHPDAPPQGWWGERGPVVPHDSFPADCSLCHVGDDWTTIREDFTYDHALETGYALTGAHAGPSACAATTTAGRSRSSRRAAASVATGTSTRVASGRTAASATPSAPGRRSAWSRGTRARASR